jgi:hypothetical protein
MTSRVAGGTGGRCLRRWPGRLQRGPGCDSFAALYFDFGGGVLGSRDSYSPVHVHDVKQGKFDGHRNTR